MLFSACSKKESIQTYFVEKHEDIDFTSFDLSAKTLFSNMEELTQEERKKLENISKLNVLILKSDENEKVDQEYAKVSSILGQKDYSSLLSANSEMGSMMMNIKGDDVNNINELVFVGKNDDFGLIVARVLGKQINPNNFYQTLKLTEKMDTEVLENFAGQFGDIQ